MKILVVGGTGFIGQHVVRQLAALGHRVAVLHRGQSNTELPAERIVADRRELASLDLKADIVIDMILSSGAQAERLMNAFRGKAGRVVAASSGDVYRACGILHGSDAGPLEPMPLREDSALRTKLQTYPPGAMKILKSVFGWVDDEYDKIPVERAIMSDPDLPGTIVRLPMTYGPGDRLHRFWPTLKRIDDGRPFILVDEQWAEWRGPRGYVENAAAALVTAAISGQAAARIYNYAETPAFTEREWSRRIAVEAGWPGRFISLPHHRMPAHLTHPGRSEQHWEMDSMRIREELGYSEPVPLSEALQRTIAWERANPPAEPSPYRFDYAAEDAATTAA